MGSHYIGRLFQTLARLPRLVVINASRNHISQGKIQTIDDELDRRHMNIQEYDFSDNNIDDVGLTKIINIVQSNRTQVQILNIANNQFTNSALEALMSSSLDPEGNLKIQELITSNVVMRDGGEGIAINKQLRNLRKFEIKDSKLDGILDFSELGTIQNKLLCLTLSKCRLTEGTIINLVETYLTTCFCIVERLDLSENDLSLASAKSLSRFIEFNPFLTHLNLSQTRIGNSGAYCILNGWFDGFDSSCIRSLDLSGNRLSFRLFDSIQTRFEDHPINVEGLLLMENLNLSKNNLDDRAIKSVLEIIKSLSAKIGFLDFSNNQLTSRSLRHLRTFFDKHKIFSPCSLRLQGNAPTLVTSTDWLELRAVEGIKVQYTCAVQSL